MASKKTPTSTERPAAQMPTRNALEEARRKAKQPSVLTSKILDSMLAIAREKDAAADLEVGPFVFERFAKAKGSQYGDAVFMVGQEVDLDTGELGGELRLLVSGHLGYYLWGNEAKKVEAGVPVEPGHVVLVTYHGRATATVRGKERDDVARYSIMNLTTRASSADVSGFDFED